MLLYEAQPLIRQAQYRELVVLAFILILTCATGILYTAGVPVPNPADLVRRAVEMLPVLRDIVLPGVTP
ncbi:MAG: hypothetical protein R6U70_09955 [Bacillota bacterium]